MTRYLLITQRTPNFDPRVVQDHFDFLDELRARDQLELSGAFTDKTGGAYILRGVSLEEAQSIAAADPLATSGSSTITVHEWDAK